MKNFLLILAFTLAFVFAEKNLKAQVFEFKSWHGAYPEMNGSYPLYFIAFKGSLIPIPHEFIRIWPTHYYMEVVALPTYDTDEYISELKVDFLKIAAKELEKSQMEKRHSETEQIKNNIEMERDMEKKIFDANSDQLPDVYSIASGFIRLYLSINRLDKLDNCKWLKPIYQKEANELLSRFVAINLFQTDHGKKLDAFAEIQQELNHQLGETDYTYRKVHHYQFYSKNTSNSYAFLKN